jgi:uncharacterized protein YbbK (DUF523 family)
MQSLLMFRLSTLNVATFGTDSPSCGFRENVVGKTGTPQTVPSFYEI